MMMKSKVRYTPLKGLSRVGFLFSRSNGLRWNAVFDAPRRVVAQISSVIKRKVSVCWTQEHPELHFHAEHGNEISQKPTPKSLKGGIIVLLIRGIFKRSKWGI
jgi:hypothetical protein